MTSSDDQQDRRARARGCPPTPGGTSRPIARSANSWRPLGGVWPRRSTASLEVARRDVRRAPARRRPCAGSASAPAGARRRSRAGSSRAPRPRRSARRRARRGSRAPRPCTWSRSRAPRRSAARAPGWPRWPPRCSMRTWRCLGAIARHSMVWRRRHAGDARARRRRWRAGCAGGMLAACRALYAAQSRRRRSRLRWRLRCCALASALAAATAAPAAHAAAAPKAAAPFNELTQKRPADDPDDRPRRRRPPPPESPPRTRKR